MPNDKLLTQILVSLRDVVSKAGIIDICRRACVLLALITKLRLSLFAAYLVCYNYMCQLASP